MIKLSTSWCRHLPLLASLFISIVPYRPAFADDDVRSNAIETVVATGQRLDTARAGIEAYLGASTYTLSNDAVENRPGGETTTLNKVLLQMPGVVQLGSGQISLRGGSDLQYRINNVIVPEGLSDLGESLSPRIADKIELVTGALPAQYGLQVAGVVNVTTKSGAYEQEGQIELYGGSHGEIEPAFEYADSFGDTNVSASGSYQSSRLGLSSPDGSAAPLHDHTRQLEGFTYVDHTLDTNSRISLIAGITNERFEVPNARGLNADSYQPSFGFVRPLQVDGMSSYASEDLAERQEEKNAFGILSYLWTGSALTLQASLYGRSSKSEILPDPIGDLLFYGNSTSISRDDLAGGLQFEGVYALSAAHILRAGIVASSDRTKLSEDSLVVPVDLSGNQLATIPTSVASRLRETENKVSAYLQDEWHPAKNLTINGGFRFDYVREDNGGSRTSPRLNVVYVLNELTFHLGYAQYFVPAPVDNSDEMAALLAGTSGRFAGAAGGPLRSETDNYYDGGVRWMAGDFSAGVDGYWRSATNIIDTGYFAGSPIARPFNFRSGRIAGVEFSATYADGPLASWANLAISEGHAKDINSHQYFFSPTELQFSRANAVPLGSDQKVTATLGASYHWRQALFTGSLSYGSGVRSKTVDTGFAGTHAPSHIQVDLTAVYHLALFGDEPLDLRLDLVNLFDSRYQIQDGAGPGGSLAQWGPRREVYVGLEQSF